MCVCLSVCVCVCLSVRVSALFNADRTKLLTEKDQILERWAEHFNQVLNRPDEINDAAIASLSQTAINDELDDPPTEDEVKKAIKQLSCGKAPGPDAIHAEVYKSGEPSMLITQSCSNQCGMQSKYCSN